MIRQLSRSIREYKMASLATPLLVSGEVVMECLIPFLIAELVNEVKSGCDMNRMLRYGLLLVLMAALSLAFGALAGCTCARASCGLARNLRKDLFYSIQDYSFENIDHFTTSSLVTRMTTDVTNVQNAYMMIIRTAIRAPLMLVFAFAMAFRMGGRMAWIFLFVVPFLGAGLALVTARTMPLFKKVFRKYDRLNRSVQENIQAMRVVKSFVRESHEEEKFAEAAGDVCTDFTRAERILALNSPMMQFCMYAVMVFVLSFGSYTVITTRGLALDVGQMSALLTYSFMMLNSLMMVSMVFVMITMAGESGNRIAEVLSERSTLTNVSGGQKQRLCIARALLKHPKVLILDDSTSAVDTKTDAAIRKALRTCLPDTTKIIIAQRTASVEDADRILVLDGGRIHGMGTHAQLLHTDAIYREIYTSQNKEGTQIEE